MKTFALYLQILKDVLIVAIILFLVVKAYSERYVYDPVEVDRQNRIILEHP